MHSGPVHHHQRMRKMRGVSATISAAVWDRIVWVVAFLGPIFTLPQLYEVWIARETAGVSVISWASYTVFSSIWIVYSVIHKQKVLLVHYIFWALVNGLVALGAFIF